MAPIRMFKIQGSVRLYMHTYNNALAVSGRLAIFTFVCRNIHKYESIVDSGLHGARFNARLTSLELKRVQPTCIVPSVWQGRAVCEKSRDLLAFMFYSLSCSKCWFWNVLSAALRTNNLLIF